MTSIVTQGQPAIPPGGSDRRVTAAKAKAQEEVRAGQLAGGNLQVAQETGNRVNHAQQQGAPRPELASPLIQPDAAGYQDALGALNKLAGTGEMSNGELGSRLQALAAQAPPPRNALRGGEGVNEIVIGQTADGFAGVVDGADLSVNVHDKSMQFVRNGQTVHMQVLDEDTLSARLDGQAFDLGDDEVGSLNQFFLLMSLFHTMGVEQRKMSREGRNMANKEVVAKIKEQAEEQRSAAAAKLAAGVVSGTVKMASASLTMVGSVKGMKADQAAAQAGAPGRPGDMISQQWRAMGQMVEGLGEAGASTIQYQAGLHEARATELRAGEEQARFVKQSEQDQMQVHQDLITKARDSFAQVWSQYLQTQQSIARNI